MKFKANAKKATLILQRRLDALQQKCLLSTTPTEESKPILALSQQIINAIQHEEVIVWFLGSEYVVKKNTKKWSKEMIQKYIKTRASKDNLLQLFCAYET